MGIPARKTQFSLWIENMGPLEDVKYLSSSDCVCFAIKSKTPTGIYPNLPCLMIYVLLTSVWRENTKLLYFYNSVHNMPLYSTYLEIVIIIPAYKRPLLAIELF